METFPSYAKMHLAGFGEEAESGVQRTSMESGPPKQLKVRSRVLVRRAVAIRLNSKTDYLAFVAWFQSDLNMGADWFTWSDPVSGTSKSARFVSSLGRAAPVGRLADAWLLSATVETWSA